MKKTLILVAVLIVIITIIGTYTKINFPYYFNLSKKIKTPLIKKQPTKKIIVSEESVITKVVAQSLPSVVTVGIKKTISTRSYTQIDPFNFFSPEIANLRGESPIVVITVLVKHGGKKLEDVPRVNDAPLSSSTKACSAVAFTSSITI